MKVLHQNGGKEYISGKNSTPKTMIKTTAGRNVKNVKIMTKTIRFRKISASKMMKTTIPDKQSASKYDKEYCYEKLCVKIKMGCGRVLKKCIGPCEIVKKCR